LLVGSSCKMATLLLDSSIKISVLLMDTTHKILVEKHQQNGRPATDRHFLDTDVELAGRVSTRWQPVGRTASYWPP
jgi:hypothetical protein